MTIPRRRFCVGGCASVSIRGQLTKESDWFRVDCLRLVDDVIMMLDYMNNSNESDRILDHILRYHKIDRLPDAPEHWSTISSAPMRIYYIIKRSLTKGYEAVNYLTSMIKIDDNYIVVRDSNEPGDNW